MTAENALSKTSPGKNFSPGPDLITEKALIMSGFGINSEMETQEVLLRAGMA
jgi:hypothetical protein